uniref:Uncharacterized protein n=1 Tax=Prevotella sp. GTC17262 TaxID=3236797 RepID=A0AB33JKZ8_9BACT
MLESHAQKNKTEFRFHSAYKEIVNMLEDRQPLSIKRSVFLAEWAYLDGALDYKKDFCVPLSKGAQFMQRLITVNKWNKYKTAKQIAICTFFFHPLSGNNNTIFTYDFTNEYPDGDWHHQLVSRTLKTHKGQCHSLPWAFKLYAEELGAKAYITHAPRHCFIMYKDEDNLFPEDWVNVEVTSQQYQPTWSIKEHFEIKDSAIYARTYLAPLTDKETVACQLCDLAFAYYKKTSHYDEFTLNCATKSLKYYKANPTAIIIKGKSLENILYKHLELNGHLRDAFTDNIVQQLTLCFNELKATYWTKETEALQKKWNMSEENINNIKKKIKYVK